MAVGLYIECEGWEMKIKLTNPGDYPRFTGVAKRFKDLPHETQRESTDNIFAWRGDEVFIDIGVSAWMFLQKGEYVVIEEGHQMNQQKLLLQSNIDALNTLIDGLRNAGVELHDDNDFAYVIDYVYYSKAQDKAVIKYKEARVDETV